MKKEILYYAAHIASIKTLESIKTLAAPATIGALSFLSEIANGIRNHTFYIPTPNGDLIEVPGLAVKVAIDLPKEIGKFAVVVLSGMEA